MSYEIDTTVDVARIEYQYEDNIIMFVIDRQDSNTASRITSVGETKTVDIVYGTEDQEIVLEKIQRKQDKKPSYSAQWKMNDIVYYISGKIEEQELRKILEQMKF